MLTVYYDGKCGLCRKETSYYQRIASPHDFLWVDLTQAPESFTAKGYLLSDGLKELHVENAQGRMHTGIDAFIRIWNQLPKWRILAGFVSFPLVKPITKLIYQGFAKWRFSKLSHCKISLRAENS